MNDELQDLLKEAHQVFEKRFRRDSELNYCRSPKVNYNDINFEYYDIEILVQESKNSIQLKTINKNSMTCTKTKYSHLQSYSWILSCAMNGKCSIRGQYNDDILNKIIFSVWDDCHKFSYDLIPTEKISIPM